MTLSKRGDYVMRSAISLARAFEAPTPRKIREVVADTEVPRTFAPQILVDLVRAGLATSKAGRDGGYRLSRDPSQITVLEVIEAGEGPLRAERCALGEGPCRWDAVCPMHETWSQATVAIRDLLARTSLADLAARDAAIEAGEYIAPADSHRAHPVTVAISDAVHIELPVADVDTALARLAPHVESLVRAGIDAANERRRPKGDRDGRTGVAVEVTMAPVKSTGSSDGKSSSYMLAWRILEDGDGPSFEAELSASALDTERTELQVQGTWRHSNQARLGANELEGGARRTLRQFLRRLAWTLEEPGDPRKSMAGSRRRTNR